MLRSLSSVEKRERLRRIGGSPVDLLNMPDGCPFAPRCDAAMKVCLRHMPKEIAVGDGHYSRCWKNIKDKLADGSITLERLKELCEK